MFQVCWYYNVDADKQMAINIFLGVYQPGEGIPDIWDLTTDYYLHHTKARVLPSSYAMPNHTKWWQSELIDHLPLPLYRGVCTLHSSIQTVHAKLHLSYICVFSSAILVCVFCV